MSVSGFKINPRGVQAATRALEREFAKRPVRVPVVTGVISPAEGITESVAELVAGWLLDWLHLYAADHRGSIPSVQELVEATDNHDLAPLVERHVEAAVDTLVTVGLVERLADYGPGGMATHIHLTAGGRLEAGGRIERRVNNKERRASCRHAVLRWVYEQDAQSLPADLELVVSTPYGWYNGVTYEMTELATAADYLRNAGLIAGADAALTLTADGTTCVEQYGDVVTFLKRGDSAGVAVVIHGDNNGQLAVANRDVTQSQEQSLDPRVLQVFAQAIRELADLLPEQADELGTVASSLDAEAEKEAPDRAWVGALLSRARRLLEKANNVQGVAQLAGLGLQLFAITQGIGG